MIDLDGFRDLVDALGGVKIRVRERIVDEVTRPAWGETNPRINVYPGRTYHFDGRTALAYVRSRKDSDDYTRMHRQRCFLTAIANQLDVVSVLRNFSALASIVESSVQTDIPRDQLPDLIRLIGRLDPSGRSRSPSAAATSRAGAPTTASRSQTSARCARRRVRRSCNYARTAGATSRPPAAPVEGDSQSGPMFSLSGRPCPSRVRA